MPSFPSDSNHRPNNPDSDSSAKIHAAIQQLRQQFFTKAQLLEYDQRETFPEQAIRAMFQPEFGLQRIFIPRAHGGLGGSTHECCQICRTMAGVCLGISTAFFSVLIGAQPLLIAGTATQKRKWLTAIAGGGRPWRPARSPKRPPEATCPSSKPRPSRNRIATAI